MDTPTLDAIDLIVHTLWFLGLTLAVICGIGAIERALAEEQWARRLDTLRGDVRAVREAAVPGTIAAQMTTTTCGLCHNPRPLPETAWTWHARTRLMRVGICADCAGIFTTKEAA